jgi:hypothetical protein
MGASAAGIELHALEGRGHRPAEPIGALSFGSVRRTAATTVLRRQRELACRRHGTFKESSEWIEGERYPDRRPERGRDSSPLGGLGSRGLDERRGQLWIALPDDR